ncbi:MAG: TusE/DsrC/DsvC family sulfur relay protein [Gammaproteobacteria bacterium SHHR-1]|uniref:TusE/DsrC/DsvC family sulfur relay protein n=1 Tax=Magnetovirga frankeli TaxID=947516 RepID=UPI0012940EA3|nr:TusE/DsrC/DsvC family sulfur relay protein [gamma proteobacterium SS-5]
MKATIERDAEGYLLNPDDWDEDMAKELAQEEGIELNPTHWQILRFIREYFSEHRIVPDVRHVDDYLASQQDMDKKDAKKILFDLFPYGYVKQACKISGMRKPRAWSTG